MSVKLLTEHNLEFLRLKGGCTGSFESTLVKISHCWKSHVAAQIAFLPKNLCWPSHCSTLLSQHLTLLCGNMRRNRGLLGLGVSKWRCQNAEKVTHIKGRLLNQAMILFNCVPFQNGNFS